MEITGKTVDTIRLPEGKSELIVTDSKIPGFGIRIRAGGSRVLVFSYKLGTKNRRLTLGPAIKEAFPEVRKRALELLSQVRLGKDPAAEKEAARARATTLTFEAVAQRYLAEQAKSLKPRSLTETNRYLLVVAKGLHSRAVTDIQRVDIAQLLSTAATERGDITANRLRSNLSSMFTWAAKEGLCEANPVANTNKRDETSRDRVLTMDELVAVWRAAADTPSGDIIQLLMLTACRRDEIGGLRWSEVDDARITLPKERVKNGREHVVPLAPAARDILTRRPHIVGWPCVFSSAERGYANWADTKARIDALLPHLAHWTLHDLRRSVATHMAERLQIQPHIIEAVLNHYSGSRAGVAGIYNRATYLNEKTAALTLWAEHLMAAVTGISAKVVPLRA